MLMSPVWTLNILLTTTDNWVAKNIRMLYSHLKEHNHNVILIAPLYQTPDDEQANSIEDGGEYGHLLPVHQTYFKNIKLVNLRKAKNVLPRQEAFDPVRTNQFGQDPLDKNIWYINKDALEILPIATTSLIPKYYPDFQPDLLIIGPNEGLESVSKVDHMIEYSLRNNFPAIGISTQASHAIYYQDEKYFQINPSSSRLLLKNNIFAKNIKYLNSQVDSIIETITHAKAIVGLNILIPSINHAESRCTTSRSNKLRYEQVSLSSYSPNQRLESDGDRDIKIEPSNLNKREDSLQVEDDNNNYTRSTFVDESSYYYRSIYSRNEATDETNHDVSLEKRHSVIDQVLESCKIAVEVKTPNADNPDGLGQLINSLNS